jgi:O-antigen/teichoic acid export membrane protein
VAAPKLPLNRSALRRWAIVKPRWSAMRRISVSLGDQAVSSATNFAAAIVAARSLSQEAFGGFSLALVTCVLATGAFRALSAEVLLVRMSAQDSFRSLARVGAGNGFAVGAAAGALVVVLVAPLSSEWSSMLVLAASLPLLFTLDSIRYVSFALNSPRWALYVDVAWLAAMVAGMWLVAESGATTPAPYVAAWALSGGAVCVACLAVSRVVPSCGSGLRWLWSHRDMGARYSLDYAASTGVNQAYFYLVAAIAGLAAVGGLRGAQTLMGPLNVAYSGIYVVLIPEGRRLHSRGNRVLINFYVGVSGLLAAGAFALVALLLAAPESVGRSLLGDSWESARALLIPVGLTAAINGAYAGAMAGIRSADAPKEVVRARILSLPALIVAPIAGVVIGGVEGAAWGLAFASFIAGVVYWISFARLVERRECGAERTLHRETILTEVVEQAIERGSGAQECGQDHRT